MAFDTRLVGYLAQGTAASRPSAPNAATNTLSFYFASDTETLSFYDWNDAAWQDIAAPTTASTTEVLTGTDTSKSVTPDALAALWEQGSDIASAGTISVGEGGYFHVTGTTTITDIDFGTTKAGRWALLVFDGALTLTHNATTLILPTGANITTAAGDACLVVSEGGDNVRVVWYQRKSGAALSGGSGQAQIYETFTTPVDGDFAWRNQGGASITSNANGSLFLMAPANSGTSLRLREKAAPGSTPYTITIAVIPHLVNINFQSCGLMINDGTKVILYAVEADAGKTVFQVAKYNTVSAFSASSDIACSGAPGTLVWLRLEDNGTNRIFYYSFNGYNFVQLHSEGRTTHLTATNVGFGANTETTSYDAGISLHSYVTA